MKTMVLTIAALAVAGATTALAVVGLGLYNVSAREGHLAGVPWLLHTTYRQSVRLRAPSAAEVPDDLASPGRVALGEGHYLSACAFCHATPGTERGATVMSMEPRPPHITEAVSGWEPQHLFWIVNEGVKMSGMPHWPADHRGDEVWSVVAYLSALQGSPDRPAAPRGDVTCTACHGEEGRSRNPYVPRLDILRVTEIRDAMRQYREGSRNSGFMQHVARGMDDAAIERHAQKFGQSETTNVGTTPAKDGSPGALLAFRGTRDQPACAACHGPGRDADQPIAPSLAGQSVHYLEAQLKLWREGHRGGGDRANLMRKAARELTDADIAALAAWYASLD